jgi:ribonuclease J
VPSGRVFIDGKSFGDVEDVILRDRWRLAQDGIIIILLSIEKLSAKVISEPDIITRGFVVDDASDYINEELKQNISGAIESMDSEIVRDTSLFKTKIRNMVKKQIKQRFHQRPMIIPIIMEV